MRAAFPACHRGSLLVLLFTISCSSPYLRNRGHDALDVFTVEFQTRSYGASVRAGPVKLGLSYKSPNGLDVGLRGGDFGRHSSAEFTAIAIGADYFQKNPLTDLMDKQQKTPTDQKADKDKKDNTPPAIETPESEAATETPRLPVALPALRDKEFRARSPFGTTIALQKKTALLKKPGNFAPLTYYTGIEVSLGLFFGIRIGLNPVEFLDAVVGWTTLDLFGDDEPYETAQERELKKNPLYNTLTDEQKQKLREQMRK